MAGPGLRPAPVSDRSVRPGQSSARLLPAVSRDGTWDDRTRVDPTALRQGPAVRFSRIGAWP
jgi:hypothetical protein